MIRSLFATPVRWFRSALAEIGSVTWGAVAAAAVLCGWLQLVALAGTSQPVQMGMAAASVVGVLLGLVALQFCNAWIEKSARRFFASHLTAGLWFLLAATVVVTPWWLELAEAALFRPGVISVEGGSLISVVAGIAAIFSLTIPAALAVVIACHPGSGNAVAKSSGPFLIGTACGVTFCGFFLSPITGPFVTGALVAAGALSCAIYQFWRGEATTAGRSDSAVIGMPSIGPDHAPLSKGEGDNDVLSTLGSALALGSAAAVVAALARVADQLSPATVYQAVAIVAGVLIGCALGGSTVARCRRMGRNVDALKWIVCCTAAVAGIGVLAVFPWLTRASLLMNATFASSNLLLAGRAAISILMVLPLGFAAGCILSRPGGRGLDAIRWSLPVTCSGIGLCVGIGLIPVIGTANVLISACYALAATACLGWLRMESVPARLIPRATMAAVMVALLVAPAGRGNYRPELAAKTLFSTKVFVALRNGLPDACLPYLDEGRHILSAEGEGGTLTVWKYGGNQIQLRENGIPRGVISADPLAFPQFVPEALQTALPLVLHEKPASLLVLGMGTGQSLTAGLAFPVPKIVCCESDPGIVGLVQNRLLTSADQRMIDDDRLRIVIGEPRLAAAAMPQRFDVVVSFPDHVMLCRAQPYLTAEFYRLAARRLTAEGIFCQRVQCIDLGPDPLRVIVRTVQSAFREVIGIEVAPGEVLLLGTNSEEGLVRPKLVERLQLPHVCSLLAESGLDWSVLLNIPAYSDQALRKFTTERGHSLNSVANNRLAALLPREVMRWGLKAQELNAALGIKAQRLLNWLTEEEAAAPELVRRLAEIRGQQDLMTKYADQYWAYRASLRDQVTRKNRSQIRQVSDSTEKKGMHPEDRRRIRYFTALGAAVKSKSAADIEHLSDFEAPYDPLMSYFLHQEAAELYSHSRERDFAAELRHRLHATYFSSPRDASLRNVVECLKLLREHPEATPDALARWDHLNALLQALQGRWEARTGIKPTDPKAVLADIDTTVLAAEQTLAAMDSLTAEAGLTSEMWTARRRALEKTLIRDVQAYRSEILPHVQRSRQKAKDAIDESATATEAQDLAEEMKSAIPE